MDDNPVPPGKTWVTLELTPEEWRSGDYEYCDLDLISCIHGPKPETSDQKKARFLREAAELIRQGTRADSPVWAEELRTGFLRIAEALEIE